MNEKIKKLAEDTHFNIYNSPIWNGTGQRFVEAIIRECADIALREDHDPYECILTHFGIEK
jgi:hypothetical protein